MPLPRGGSPLESRFSSATHLCCPAAHQLFVWSDLIIVSHASVSACKATAGLPVRGPFPPFLSYCCFLRYPNEKRVSCHPPPPFLFHFYIFTIYEILRSTTNMKKRLISTVGPVSIPLSHLPPPQSHWLRNLRSGIQH